MSRLNGRELVSNEEDNTYYRLTKPQAEIELGKLADFLFAHAIRWKNDKRINETKAYLDASRLMEEQCNVINQSQNKVKRTKRHSRWLVAKSR